MKSHESDLIELATNIYRDAVAKCTAIELDMRDIDTIVSRVKHEGISFLTITLPNLGKDVERCLSLGFIDSTCFRSFKKHGKAPAFLQGFFSQMFDSSTGSLHSHIPPEVIEGIRQLSYTFKKVKMPCTDNRIKNAFRKYKECENDLEKPLDPLDIEKFLKVSNILWGNTISQININDIVPKHGPGSTAEKITGNKKFKFLKWHDRLEPYFPLLHNAFSSESAYSSKEFENIIIVDELSEQPVRVVTVPKTLSGPRIIALEPVCMQYTQQAILDSLVKTLESYPLTLGHINFTDQSINRNLAIISSETLEYATIDITSASDRVPLYPSLNMFDSNPDLRDAILACRSMRAELPTGEIIHLKKFASMGSALCFPIESMYFYTICIVALLEKRKLPVTYWNIHHVSRDVYVYGDDIIIPTNEAGTVMETLHKYYCKVNATKSFVSGSFRESCGMDAYDGEQVIPTYIREMQPHNRRDSNALISWVDTANLFYKQGYWLTSSHMFSICESILGKLPIVGEQCAGLGKHSFQRWVSTNRWNPNYQVDEVKTWCVKPVRQKDELADYAALTKCLLNLQRSNNTDPVTDKDHLSNTVRRGAVTLKRRWTRPY